MNLKYVVILIMQINADDLTLPLPFARPVLTSAILLICQAQNFDDNDDGLSEILKNPVHCQYNSRSLNTHSASWPCHWNYSAKRKLL